MTSKAHEILSMNPVGEFRCVILAGGGVSWVKHPIPEDMRATEGS